MLHGIVEAALALALAVGAGAPPGASPAAQAAEVRPLKIGLAAMISPKETLAYYNRLLAHVGRRLGRRVEMVQYRTYDEMDTALERRDVEIAFICSGPYVHDRERFGAELLVAPQAGGAPVYYAYLIVPAASPATSLADLRGKSFALTDPKSNTGRLVPEHQVWSGFGVSPEAFFSEVRYTYSHDRSIDQVASGAVDGASVDSLIYDYLAAKAPARARGTRILSRSQPFGIPPVVVHPRIDPTLKAGLKAAFLALHEDPRGKAILDAIHVERFVVPKDADYESVRELERWVAEKAAPAKAAASGRARSNASR
jgi:phosphonate transport system substrate-binding protein